MGGTSVVEHQEGGGGGHTHTTKPNKTIHQNGRLLGGCWSLEVVWEGERAQRGPAEPHGEAIIIGSLQSQRVEREISGSPLVIRNAHGS